MQAECRDERHDFPMSERSRPTDPVTARRATIEPPARAIPLVRRRPGILRLVMSTASMPNVIRTGGLCACARVIIVFALCRITGLAVLALDARVRMAASLRRACRRSNVPRCCPKQ
jgi:hypothetical protein